jgi:hypothetical protein
MPLPLPPTPPDRGTRKWGNAIYGWILVFVILLGCVAHLLGA